MSNYDAQPHIARAIATIAHRGQTDKAGNPYIDHPARVAALLEAQGALPYVVAAGWLHDVLEDTDITKDDLAAAGVNVNVIDTVQVLTKIPNEPNDAYYERIVSRLFARQVKLADIADNSDPARLVLLDDETVARLTRKYVKARAALQGTP